MSGIGAMLYKHWHPPTCRAPVLSHTSIGAGRLVCCRKGVHDRLSLTSLLAGVTGGDGLRFSHVASGALGGPSPTGVGLQPVGGGFAGGTGVAEGSPGVGGGGLLWRGAAVGLGGVFGRGLLGTGEPFVEGEEPAHASEGAIGSAMLALPRACCGGGSFGG